MLTPIAIDKWAIVVNETNCFQALSNLKQGLETSAKKLGITLKSPKIIKISDDRSETVVKAIREMPSGCELLVSINVFFLFQKSTLDRKNCVNLTKGPFINYVVFLIWEGKGSKFPMIGVKLWSKLFGKCQVVMKYW